MAKPDPQPDPVDKKENNTMSDAKFQIESIRPGMGRDESQQAVKDILAALRNPNAGETAITEEPILVANPNDAQRSAHDEAQQKYAQHLLNRPSGSLTVKEQRFLTRAIAQFAREELR
jgi:hypothetical protein